MQCGVKRKHCPSLEHINIERQQQSLFDLSIFKLQQEQLRHGVEPRLLRFVLINNALRALQGHMFLFGDEEDFSFDSSSERCAGGSNGGAAESFLSNTFRDGGLPTTPASPPTPVKVIKLEATLSDQSPLVASTPFQSFVADSACATGGEEKEGMECANLPPCERLDGIVSCGSSSEGRESAVREALSTTMTTVEERPADFSTTTVTTDDLPCACRRTTSLGKRRREELEKGEDLVNSNARLCQCGGSRAGEDEHVESVHYGDREEESIEKDCSCSASKKMCTRPIALSINGTKRINGINGLNSVYTVLGLDPPTSCSSSSHPTQSSPGSPEEPDEESSTTPSPIDFTKVDPSLYDYDDKAPLFISTQDPPTATPTESNGHGDGVRDDHNGVGDSESPDSSSTLPSSSSLSCSSGISQSAVPSPIDDTTPCSSAESVTSPTLAITATSTTFSLPSSSEYPLISSSNHDCSVSQSCATSSIDSNLIGSDSGSKRCRLSPSSSCSLEGLVSAQNGNLVHNSESERTENEASISNGLNGGVPSSPEGAENDFLEDIVSLLMT